MGEADGRRWTIEVCPECGTYGAGNNRDGQGREFCGDVCETPSLRCVAVEVCPVAVVEELREAAKFAVFKMQAALDDSTPYPWQEVEAARSRLASALASSPPATPDRRLLRRSGAGFGYEPPAGSGGTDGS